MCLLLKNPTRQYIQLCRCRSTFFIPLPRKKSVSTKRNAWCSLLTPTSWMLNAQVATRLQPCLVTLKLLSFVVVAQLSSVNQLVAEPDLLKDVPSDGNTLVSVLFQKKTKCTVFMSSRKC